MKMKKALLTLVLCVMLVFSLSACGSGTGSSAERSGSSTGNFIDWVNECCGAEQKP